MISIDKSNYASNVLFVSQSSAYPQMGVLYLMDALEKANIGSEHVASDISEEMFEAIITFYKPDVLAMSVMTAPEVSDFVRLSKYSKQHYPDVPIVWGGVHPTLLADSCLEEEFIDHVFVGQAEDLFPDVVTSLTRRDGRFGRKIIGYAPVNLDSFRPAWEKINTAQFLFSERHSVRSPDERVWHVVSNASESVQEFLEGTGDAATKTLTKKWDISAIEKWDVGQYDMRQRIFYYLITSRGCPYKCTFCSEPLQIMHGTKEGKFLWNAHSFEWVKEQVTTLRGLLKERNEAMDGIGIWDDMFWVRYRRDPRALDVLNYFRENDLGYLIEARADQLLRDDGSLFKTLADTGCLQVFVGAESASQETLNYIRKGTKVEDYRALMIKANEARVALRMSFIVGFPNESDDSVNATLDACEAIENGEFGPWVNVSGPKIFTPYPGTIEYERAVKSGFRVPKNHEEWGKIHRSTEEYLYHFPWLEKNLKPATLRRLAKIFGEGHRKLRSH